VFKNLWPSSLLLLISFSTSARVTSLSERGLAFFVRGTLGQSWLHQEAFVHASEETSVVPTSNYTFTGEMGVLVTVGKSLQVRFGGEVGRPRSIINADGNNANGDKLYSLDSQVLMFIPQVSIEYIYYMMTSSRFLFTAGAGYAIVNLRNHYQMTTLGKYIFQTGEITETATGKAPTFYLGTGWEAEFVDQTTMMFELGYRHLKVNGLRNTRTGRTMASPTGVESGDDLVNEDGTARKLDLSNVFVGVSFRISIM
jgi:hypothetical protein